MHQNIKFTKDFQDRMDWVHGVSDGSNKPVWERFDTQRVVSMAACIVNGYLLVGNRHFCPLMRMTMEQMGISLSPTEHEHNVKDDQGFVDQWGVWMSREEAWEVAKAAGQIKKVFTEGVLYSECYL